MPSRNTAITNGNMLRGTCLRAPLVPTLSVYVFGLNATSCSICRVFRAVGACLCVTWAPDGRDTVCSFQIWFIIHFPSFSQKLVWFWVTYPWQKPLRGDVTNCPVEVKTWLLGSFNFRDGGTRQNCEVIKTAQTAYYRRRRSSRAAHHAGIIPKRQIWMEKQLLAIQDC